jgi:hypothetical protein
MEKSDDDAGPVHGRIRFTESGDDAIATAFGGAEIDKKYLVLGVVDNCAEFAAERHDIGWCELALEDGVL